MAEFVTWCVTKRAAFKWCQIMCCLLAILFLIDGRAQWKVYSVIFGTDVFLAVATLITLGIYFMHVHRSNTKLWINIERVFNLIAVVISTIFAGVLLYDAIKMEQGDYRHHRYAPQLNIGQSGWSNRIRIVAVSQVCQAIFYLASLIWVHRHGLN
uniref:MARVEL domain-containing protein n=1 Tax=Panagrellus redivivus TaxID=6233 RepID=A0A7E4VCZ2_PANRE